jgi:hypothetical protein
VASRASSSAIRLAAAAQSGQLGLSGRSASMPPNSTPWACAAADEALNNYDYSTH